jgi:hypothetical protein
VPYLPPGAVGPSIFLYPTVEQAKARTAFGGSGFLVGLRSRANYSYVHLHAVTNEHVATVAPVIRAYPTGSAPVVLDDDDAARRWEEHPAGDDVAARYVGAFPDRSYWWVPREFFIGREDIVPPGPGPGDECFMVGRYVNYEGRQFDRAVVRFGNVAMLPEKIAQAERRGFEQESFLVDMRSVVGFSGSPVTVFLEGHGIRNEGVVVRTDDLEASGLVNKAWLLGVDWGHLAATEEIVEDGQRKRVKVKSSMAAVVPAWKLAELLDTVEGIVKPREQAEKELAEAAADPNAAVLDANEPPDEFERFEDLTRRLVRTPKPERDA